MSGFQPVEVSISVQILPPIVMCPLRSEKMQHHGRGRADGYGVELKAWSHDSDERRQCGERRREAHLHDDCLCMHAICSQKEIATDLQANGCTMPRFSPSHRRVDGHPVDVVLCMRSVCGGCMVTSKKHALGIRTIQHCASSPSGSTRNFEHSALFFTCGGDI